MRIACPNCEATYEVPDALISAGRRLRCAKCGHEWPVGPAAAVPPAPTADPKPSPDLGPAPPPILPPQRVPQPIEPPLPTPEARRAAQVAAVALWTAWIGSGLLLVALAAGIWVYRAPIVEAWPPAARLYLLLGASRIG